MHNWLSKKNRRQDERSVSHMQPGQSEEFNHIILKALCYMKTTITQGQKELQK